MATATAPDILTAPRSLRVLDLIGREVDGLRFSLEASLTPTIATLRKVTVSRDRRGRMKWLTIFYDAWPHYSGRRGEQVSSWRLTVDGAQFDAMNP